MNGTELKGEKAADVSSDVKKYSFELGKRLEDYKIKLAEEAGNTSEMTLTAGPGWLRTGIIPTGEVFLEGQTKYQLDQGSWSVEGDKCLYTGGQKVFAATEGDYNFSSR